MVGDKFKHKNFLLTKIPTQTLIKIRTNNLEKKSISEISRELGITVYGGIKAIKDLERIGLIQVGINQGCRRKKTITMTKKGEKIADYLILIKNLCEK